MQYRCRIEAFAAYDADCAAFMLLLCVLLLVRLPLSLECERQV
jgi:hypothetical protein